MVPGDRNIYLSEHLKLFLYTEDEILRLLTSTPYSYNAREGICMPPDVCSVQTPASRLDDSGVSTQPWYRSEFSAPTAHHSAAYRKLARGRSCLSVMAWSLRLLVCSSALLEFFLSGYLLGELRSPNSTCTASPVGYLPHTEWLTHLTRRPHGVQVVHSMKDERYLGRLAAQLFALCAVLGTVAGRYPG
ncbi:hypothetical protein BJX96DRAFT_47069 [Aspergillus floccosus]